MCAEKEKKNKKKKTREIPHEMTNPRVFQIRNSLRMGYLKGHGVRRTAGRVNRVKLHVPSRQLDDKTVCAFVFVFSRAFCLVKSVCIRWKRKKLSNVAAFVIVR